MVAPTSPPDSPAFRRVLAALRGEPVDRVPFAFWRRFPREEGDPEALAEATWAFAQDLGMDLVRLTPGPFYAVEDWGAEVSYPSRGDEPPVLQRPLIRTPEEWRDLLSLDLEAGALARELEALRLLLALVRKRVPVLMTVYSPLTLAYQMAGDRLLDHLRKAPQAVHFGLAVIAETTARLAKHACRLGADGLFFVVHLAPRAHLTEAEHLAFGEHYDRVVLDPVQRLAVCTVLHLRGGGAFFHLADRYPVQAVHWEGGEGDFPPLDQTLVLTSKALVGGLRPGTLRKGSPEEAAQEARRALEATQGRRLILAPSGDLLPGTPEENLLAVREAVYAFSP
ncbi:MAG: uroporphyrinogen decarboxylase family protein [Anaerolineae bacterium]